MSNPDRYRTFFDDGFVYLRGAFDVSAACEMENAVWSVLTRSAVNRNNRETWSSDYEVHLQAVRKQDRPPAEVPAVRLVLDDLFGAGAWVGPRNWGQVLLTFPTAHPWSPRGGAPRRALASGPPVLAPRGHDHWCQRLSVRGRRRRAGRRDFDAARVLADEVGLGKTIEAGMILAELRLHGLADRTLVITPAGLVTQWQEELERKFATFAAAAAVYRADEQAIRQADRVVRPLLALGPERPW